MKAKKLRIVLFLAVLALVACSPIPKEDAESIALAFVQDRVKFFTSSNQSTTDIPSFNPSKIESYHQGTDWVVVMHVEADVEGEKKSGDLVVLMDKKGVVKSFNGKPVVLS